MAGSGSSSMTICAFLIPLMLGYLVLRMIRPLKTIDLFLIPGLGWACSAQIVFYSLLAFNRIVPEAIIGIHIAVILGLFFYIKKSKNSSHQIALLRKEEILLCVLLAIAALTAFVLAASRPYGSWDAWSFWNYRANFLMRAGENWPRVFEYGMQGQHPWLLPCMVVWGWSMSQGEFIIVPIMISILFTVSCIGLLVCALKEHISFGWALLAGLFLMSIPFFMFHGTSQYAEVVLAYFLLGIFVLALEMHKTPTVPGALLMGLFLGFAACTKDNGIILLLGLLFIVMGVWLTKMSKDYVKAFAWATASVMVSVLLMKSFSLLNLQNSGYGILWSGWMQSSRWVIILEALVRSVTSPYWGGMWPLACLVLFFQKDKIRGEGGIQLILKALGFYLLFYVGVYSITAQDLRWLLDVSFDRVLYIWAPTLILITFYILGKKKL
jgi:hypothetical protein